MESSNVPLILWITLRIVHSQLAQVYLVHF